MDLLDIQALTLDQREKIGSETCDLADAEGWINYTGDQFPISIDPYVGYLLFQDWFGLPYGNHKVWTYHLVIPNHWVDVIWDAHWSPTDIWLNYTTMAPIGIDQSKRDITDFVQLISTKIRIFRRTLYVDQIGEKLILEPASFLKKLDYHLKFSLSNNLRYRVVSATGCYPFGEVLIKSLAYWQDAIIGDKSIWGSNEIIVIGRNGFDKEYLKQSIVVGQEEGFQCHYISQEDFLRLIRLDIYPNYYQGDPRISEHEGLEFMASIGFEWPTTQASPTPIPNSISGLDWDDHALLKKYGYSVRKGVTVKERRKALESGVQGLGLQEVSYHIARLIRLNKRRKTDRLENAIANWTQDLSWLYDTKYRNTVDSFVWPNPDLDNW